MQEIAINDPYLEDWIKPVTENIIWICQLPRSGGTLLLRLFDSHPELHCYPAVFGFSNEERIWPYQNDILKSENVLDEIFSYMNMEKFHLKGMAKQSSNMNQETYPVYFDGKWYRDIFKLYLKGSEPRDYFNAFFTALFNSWRNYQNLYGNKKYICGQMTLRKPELYKKNHEHFTAVYPNGKMIFMIRKPDDWLASAINLRKSTPFSKDPYEIMDYYKIIMKQAVSLADKGALIVFSFEDLIKESRLILEYLSSILGITWNDCLLHPTFNGSPFFPNSSFELERKSVVNPNVIGKGKQLSRENMEAIDEETYDLYSQIQTYLKI